MNITQLLTWPATNWPASSPATEYSVFQVYPNSSPTVITTSSTTSASIAFNDSQNLVYQIRPSSSSGPTYGPEIAVFVVGYVPCRAWLRQNVRQAIADRTDGANATINWPDDELNGYIQNALIELNVLFPIDADTTITLQPNSTPGIMQSGIRDYDLPADFFQARTIEYITVDGKLHLFLKEKPFKGGESTATSYLGYPKLGILLSPVAGRYYPGHYDIYENQVHIDWDPAGDGDYLKMRYAAKRPFPANDADIMNVAPDDMALLSLRTQMACWLRIEGNDTRLSRWRTREDGGKRDDMPTVRHSLVIKGIYNEMVNDRRELRPKVRRLVRR